MRYAFIKEHRGEWSVERMAEALAVSASGFYSWLKRPKSKRAQEDEALTKKILKFHCGSRCTYGSPRIHKDLKAIGQRLGRKRVARLMKESGIRGKTKRKFKTTTQSNHKRPKADNLVKQNFCTKTPNSLWASDITYIPTCEGWLYLAVTLDVFSRKVIGWAFSKRLTDELSLNALEMGLQQRHQRSKEVIHHSDQGVQYASYAFRRCLKTAGISQSMSAKGNAYDNAVVESFFATLKIEEVKDANYQTRQQAITRIFSYIEGFYNSKRRHSSLGYLSPNEFERLYFQRVA